MHANVVSGGLVGFAIKFTARVALACAAALAGMHVASAQQAGSTAADANSSALAEIVVTAEKRSENLQQVPVAVSVMNADQLQMRGIESVADLMQGDIPSVKVEPFAGNQSVLEVAIRGFINPNGTDITNENPVRDSMSTGFTTAVRPRSLSSSMTSSAWRCCADPREPCSARMPRAARSS